MALQKIDHGSIPSVPLKNKIIDAKIVDVYDGDTCTIVFLFGTEFMKCKLRIKGIDTPEKAPKKTCQFRSLEKKAGCLVQEVVSSLILGKIVKIQINKWGKYGGRLVGELFLEDEDPGTLREYLIKYHLAKPYDGKKKEDWTEVELKKIIRVCEKKLNVENEK